MIYLTEGYLNRCESNLSSQNFKILYPNQEQTKIVFTKKLNFNNPSIITNAIIEFNEYSELSNFFKIADNLFCKHIVIKYNESLSVKNLKCVFDFATNYNIHEVLLITKYNASLYSDEFVDVLLTSNRFKSIIITESPFLKNLENYIYYVPKKIEKQFFKKMSNFINNIELISESQKHHTYFNRKLYIGPNGEIKNAPECEETFGFIQELNSVDDLREIISSSLFQKYWFVHKEITDVCKDCEFRHMCVDNRLPYKRSKEEWYHKIECNYNPFIAKWEGEEGYRTLSECGVISNEHEFSIDHEKIAQINKELWEDEY